MCRNIRVLFNTDPPSTDQDVHDAALQFVRKISGFVQPSVANGGAFNRAVDKIAGASASLLASLVTAAPPRSRAAGREIDKGLEADRSRLHEGYRSMGRGKRKFKGARKRVGS